LTPSIQGRTRGLCCRQQRHYTPLQEGLNPTIALSGAISGWVRRWYCYHPLPAELGVRLTPHPAQAARRKFQVSDSTPCDRCSRVTFTRSGISLFLWMSALLLVVKTSHPAMSAPFRVGMTLSGGLWLPLAFRLPAFAFWPSCARCGYGPLSRLGDWITPDHNGVSTFRIGKRRWVSWPLDAGSGAPSQPGR
jgi:hypothetical protein